MWGGIIGLIIQLISGAVGGNIAGSALKQYNLGTIGNSIAGVIGGGVGAQIIGALLGGGTGAEAAAERVANNTDVGRRAGQRRETVACRGLDDLDPENAGLHARDPRHRRVRPDSIGR